MRAFSGVMYAVMEVNDGVDELNRIPIACYRYAEDAEHRFFIQLQSGDVEIVPVVLSGIETDVPPQDMPVRPSKRNNQPHPGIPLPSLVAWGD